MVTKISIVIRLLGDFEFKNGNGYIFCDSKDSSTFLLLIVKTYNFILVSGDNFNIYTLTMSNIFFVEYS